VDMSLLWNQKIDTSGDDFMKYQSAACENLRASVVPWKVWFTKGDSAQELDPAIIAKLYAPDPPSAEPGVAVTYQWPTPPRFENDRVYLHWDGARQPLIQLGTWIIVCFIGTWVLLGRIEAH
jgi:hypothetical protein